MKPIRVLVDMDGVAVDYDAYKTLHCITQGEVQKKPGAYRDMLPYPGALEAIRRLIELGFDVWFCTKSPIGYPHCAADKIHWVLEWIPEMVGKIIMTPDKGMIGGPDDFLLDDRPHKANCRNFPGTLLEFTNGYHWPQALELLERVGRETRGVH